jgi:hypothetical protein
VPCGSGAAAYAGADQAPTVSATSAPARALTRMSIVTA